MRLRLVGILAWTSLLAAGGQVDVRVLPVPHLQAKMICFDCHQKEKPVTAAVPDQACMVCHGDYPAMRALTRQAKPNPHDSPHDPILCTECHRQHKPPVVQCQECHPEYTFKIK
jgi:Cytochrome c3